MGQQRKIGRSVRNSLLVDPRCAGEQKPESLGNKSASRTMSELLEITVFEAIWSGAEQKYCVRE